MIVSQKGKNPCGITVCFLEQEIFKCGFTYCPREKHQTDTCYEGKDNREMSLCHAQANLETIINISIIFYLKI